MTRAELGVAVCFALIVACAASVSAAELDWQEVGGGFMDVRSVLVQPEDPMVIFVGLKNGVFKSEDGGKTWRNILNLSGQSSMVNAIFSDQVNKEVIYVASGSGLYRSQDQGDTWNRIFRGKNTLENNCTALEAVSFGIFLGTQGGLFVSKDAGRRWAKVSGELRESQILAIAADSRALYVASVRGIFISQDQGSSWKKIFTSLVMENGLDEDGLQELPDKGKECSVIRYVSCAKDSLGQLYAATEKGVYESNDYGDTWNHITELGLLNRDITFLLAVKNLYAVSGSGIFVYASKRWEELSLRLTAGEIRVLAVDAQGNLYAACGKGLFRASLQAEKEEPRDANANTYTRLEPEISKVQQAAISYAEVGQEKIILWRKLAAARAILPKLTAGISRDSADLWHWESGSTTRLGDDALCKGKAAIDWDISLSWDLGELIWSDAQTSIDVRSRLAVELRNDILDEVTKLYFERLRTKMELDALAIEDKKKRMDKKLRIDELTASLDALTNGYFSKGMAFRSAGKRK